MLKCHDINQKTMPYRAKQQQQKIEICFKAAAAPKKERNIHFYDLIFEPWHFRVCTLCVMYCYGHGAWLLDLYFGDLNVYGHPNTRGVRAFVSVYKYKS